MKGLKGKLKNLFVEKKVPLDDEPFPTEEEIRQTKKSEEALARGDYEELKTIVW